MTTRVLPPRLWINQRQAERMFVNIAKSMDVEVDVAIRRRREYQISGMCQKCQDSVFGVS